MGSLTAAGPAAVSKTAVYVVWKDDDDIERLRRHPWSYEPVKGP